MKEYKQTQDKPDLAHESAVDYSQWQGQLATNTPEGILGISDSLGSNMSYMMKAREGLERGHFDKLKSFTGLDIEQLSSILSITPRTVQRKKKDEAFKPDISEKMLELAELYAFGIEVYGNKENFQKWIKSDLLSLGGRAPLSMLHSSFGRRTIKEELGRIQHGIF